MTAGWIAFAPSGIAAVKETRHATEFLSDAKMQAAELKDDAGRLEAFTRSDMSLVSHAQALNAIKEDVNKLDGLLMKLQDNRGDGAPAQQAALARIHPVAAELASATAAAIDRLNAEPARLNMPAYQDYLEAIYDRASRLDALVNEYADVERNRP
jgi:trans-aconitate methyltransferase